MITPERESPIDPGINDERRGGRFGIRGMTKDLRMVFELTRLDKFFEIYDDETQARTRFA